MHVICTDGTVLECDRFEAIDSGVLLFAKDREAAEGAAEDSDADEEATEEREEATAFVPHHQLRLVAPAGIRPGAPGVQSISQPTAHRGTTPATGQHGQSASRPAGGRQSRHTRRPGQGAPPESGRPW